MMRLGLRNRGPSHPASPSSLPEGEIGLLPGWTRIHKFAQATMNPVTKIIGRMPMPRAAQIIGQRPMPRRER
jgi:hypothetical protein